MFHYPKHYDVIVIGAGHAGIEASLAAARMGCQTLLLTMNLDTIGQMSCNPAIGGLAKGHLVREIDALGGEMGLNTDATGIQFRMLNASKGASVRAPRAQCDKKAYQFRMKATIERQDRLDLKQGQAIELMIENDHVTGVKTQFDIAYNASAVIVTTGTFLKGILHVGKKCIVGGRMGDYASSFSESLSQIGFEVQRLKTGTPPRVNARSIDFSKMFKQSGDEPPGTFSFMPELLNDSKNDIFTLNTWKDGLFHVEQIPCWITYTTSATKDVINSNLDKSPLFSGIIKGVGPRYCPSLEDKIVRFSDKDRHQIFLEPEGRHTEEYYVNGCSTSLPFAVQYEFIRSVIGLENAEIIRPGYAVEYDYCPPTQLKPTLETKRIEGLFFAGQINGTSGYEEAAAQGIVAGINAVSKVLNKEKPLVLGRHEAYIGVLIDDLITKGTQEPYRMFTSRAEHRLVLRQDNADLRLTEIGNRYGLASKERVEKVGDKKRQIDLTMARLKSEIKDGQSLAHWLKRPEFSWKDLPVELIQNVPTEIGVQLETEIKYAGYIEREKQQIEKTRHFEEKTIPSWIDYEKIPGLKKEASLKLKKVQPATYGQASRISGVNPTDMALVMAWSKREQLGKKTSG